MNHERFVANPYFVLELEPSASLLEIERAGQKLIAQLTIGAMSSKTYASPFGPQPRDESVVRSAVARLRDPNERILCAFWAENVPSRDAPEATAAPEEALAALDWRNQCSAYS